MQLDPGNVVAARLLADAYRNLGNHLEAIKKYKLVHALLPGDEELNATIDQLERELQAPAETEPEPEPEPEPAAASTPLSAVSTSVAPPEPAEAPPLDFAPIEESPFDRTIPPFDESTGDEEPMLAAHDESPFEEPLTSVAALEVEPPPGMQIEFVPVSADAPTPVVDEAEEKPEEAALPVDEAEVFAPPAEDLANTLTMADLYARQGLVNEAQHIYENILARDPNNQDVQARLDAITPRVNPKIDKLERWLEKVSRKEVGRV